MTTSMIGRLKQDCFIKGYGRKTWWAEQLGIPPLTLSHWLAGRQRPNGQHTLRIKEILDQEERDKQLEVWEDYLWDCYYGGQAIPTKILPAVILQVLSISSVDSRTLALLSRTVERERPTFDIPESGEFRNRLGWLLEVSEHKVPFLPDRSIKTQALLSLSSQSSGMKRYLNHYQTPSGKKWRIYDCPLDSLKRSLP